MPSRRAGVLVSLASIVGLSAVLSAAWQQPPESKLDPADPLLDTIKERMGKLPRLIPPDPVDPSDASHTQRSKGTSPRHRAAELLLKSARLLESQPAASEGELEVAKQLRKHVLVLLNEDGSRP